jgi:UDP-N-acetyl-D-glucosamine dehydrogenase
LTPTNFATQTATGIGDWLKGVQQRTTRVGVIGLGYVGLPLALLFSEERFEVTGFDIDPAKVKSLNDGQSYIHRSSRRLRGWMLC